MKRGIQVDIQIKKGVLDACVLYALKGGESYGYKILSDLKDIIDISESTLYPILKRLEAGGALKTYSREFNGRLRRYYTLKSIGAILRALYLYIKKFLEKAYEI